MQRDAPPAETLAWLKTSPSLSALCEAFPDEWGTVQREIAAAAAAQDQGRLHRLLRPVKVTGAGFRKSDPGRFVRAEIQRRMAMLEIERRSLAIAAGKARGGKIKFNLFNGFIAQRILFKRDFERKPVSMFWFRLFWPLLWQKRFLMPLVKQRGIYCFYSGSLVSGLTKEIGSRPGLEIAAGDGTLTRFLRDAGVDIRATDDYSWQRDVRYPKDVLRMDARSALEHFSPEVVICSWPPAGNDFERHVFRTRSVSTYIVIASRQRSASGNWQEYESQTGFQFAEDTALSRLVLPSELASVVYVFRRKSAGEHA
jgi:hypothetical protein